MCGFVLHSPLLQHLGQVWQGMAVSGYRCSLQCMPAERQRDAKWPLWLSHWPSCLSDLINEK